MAARHLLSGKEQSSHLCPSLQWSFHSLCCYSCLLPPLTHCHQNTQMTTLSYTFPSTTSSSSSTRRFLITSNGSSCRRRPNISTEDQPCSSSACYQGAVQSYGLQRQRVQLNGISKAVRTRRLDSVGRQKKGAIRCNIELQDFIGGDLIKPDLGQWLSDVEEHKAIAIYSPHEGGYEGRYLTRLKYQGYHFLDLSARGLGDPETTLTKFHPVCPAHVGKQPIARWYFPPEVDYRLSLLPPDAKGLVVWIIEAKVLSKAELQFLALLPTLRPNVRVIAECGNWRKFMWKPLKEIADLSQS